MQVRDVMTRDVRTVRLDTPLGQAAALLSRLDVSGAPVVDGAGRVVGVISDADVVRAAADGGIEALRLRTVEEAMSEPPITVHPWCSLTVAAQRMAGRGVRRLPVVEHGRLVGIVTRSDLARAFACTDAEIEADVARLLSRLRIPPDEVSVSVEDGDVSLRFERGHERSLDFVLDRVERVPGVMSVLASVAAGAGELAAAARG